MAESQAEQIFAKLAEVLGAMTGARPWGGSYPNAPVVEREYKAPGQITTHPHFGLLEGSGSSTRILNVNPPMNIEHEFLIGIYATVIRDREAVAQTWLQRVRDDLLATVLANASLGGLCSGIGQSISWETDEGEFGPQAQLAMTVTYKFRDTKEVA